MLGYLGSPGSLNYQSRLTLTVNMQGSPIVTCLLPASVQGILLTLMQCQLAGSFQKRKGLPATLPNKILYNALSSFVPAWQYSEDDFVLVRSGDELLGCSLNLITDS